MFWRRRRWLAERSVSRECFGSLCAERPVSKKNWCHGTSCLKKKSFNDVAPAEIGKFSSVFRAFFGNFEKRKNERFQLGGARWRLKILKNFDWKFSLKCKAFLKILKKSKKKRFDLIGNVQIFLWNLERFLKMLKKRKKTFDLIAIFLWNLGRFLKILKKSKKNTFDLIENFQDFLWNSGRFLKILKKRKKKRLIFKISSRLVLFSADSFWHKKKQ